MSTVTCPLCKGPAVPAFIAGKVYCKEECDLRGTSKASDKKYWILCGVTAPLVMSVFFVGEIDDLDRVKGFDIFRQGPASIISLDADIIYDTEEIGVKNHRVKNVKKLTTHWVGTVGELIDNFEEITKDYR